MPAGSSRSAPSERSRAPAKVRVRPRSSVRREGRVVKKRVKRKDARHHTKKGEQTRGKSAVDSSKDQHICPICHESYSAAIIPVVHAPCGHVACASCSLRWQEKKSSRTCALCRAPTLSIAHCHMLEQLLKQVSPITEKSDHEDENSKSTVSAAEQDASRQELRHALQELSKGDLNAIPGDFRSHIVRAIAYRAIRKQDLPMLKTCLLNLRARASTHLFCDVANLWTSNPRPVISLLLEHGARINGHAEERPLICAVSRGNNDMVTALLELKADPLKSTGPYGDTPLHAAACSGRFEAARILLDHGVPANIKDRYGRTPLFMAEKGLRVHLNRCEGPPCQRCEARIQLQGELRWRERNAPSKTFGSSASASAERHLSSSIRAEASEQQPAAASTPTGTDEDRAQLDAVSEYSSSEWEDSSDVSDVADWLEGEEEEAEEDGDYDANMEDLSSDDDADLDEDGGSHGGGGSWF